MHSPKYRSVHAYGRWRFFFVCRPIHAAQDRKVICVHELDVRSDNNDLKYINDSSYNTRALHRITRNGKRARSVRIMQVILRFSLQLRSENCSLIGFCETNVRIARVNHRENIVQLLKGFWWGYFSRSVFIWVRMRYRNIA
jgi:hypothetical protein